MKPDPSSAVKPDVTSLRSTIEWLRKEGLLVETEREVDPDLEITRDGLPQFRASSRTIAALKG